MCFPWFCSVRLLLCYTDINKMRYCTAFNGRILYLSSISIMCNTTLDADLIKMTSNPNTNLNRIKNISGCDPNNITLKLKPTTYTKRIWQCNTFWSSLVNRLNSYFDIWRKQGTGFWTSDTWAPLACERVNQKLSFAWAVVNLHISSNMNGETTRHCEIKD